MGCFLACFGHSKKRKRRKKSANKLLLAGDQDQDQRHGSYQPLESYVSTKLDSDFREKPKEQFGFKTKKKVSFNLNVQTYEPIPAEEQIFETDEERESYPSNYRYRNCQYSYDDEDEIVLDENDSDYDDDGDTDTDNDIDAQNISEEEESSEKIYDLSVKSRKRASWTQSDVDKDKSFMPFHASKGHELNALEINRNAGNRSQYVYSVLNPVENVTQWKAVKARAKPPLKHCSKEGIFNLTPKVNQSKPLLLEEAVDGSLSNWLCSSEMAWVT